MQPRESHSEALAVLVEGERARDTVEVDPDGRGHVFPERLDVGLLSVGVPEKALVAGE